MANVYSPIFWGYHLADTNNSSKAKKAVELAITMLQANLPTLSSDEGIEAAGKLQTLLKTYKLPPPLRPATLREPSSLTMDYPPVKGVRAAMIEFFKKNKNRPATLRQIQEGIGAPDRYTIGSIVYNKNSVFERAGTVDGRLVLWRLASTSSA